MALITPDWARMMARYNGWQNQWMTGAMASLTAKAMTKDRGAFFGSILGTANHILWADQLWMSRFDGGAAPSTPRDTITTMHPTRDAWAADRQRMDQRISLWAADLGEIDLAGDLTWFSGALNAMTACPMGLCVTHFFNHQTHHRGQIHAMLTKAGAKTDDTDLFLMPSLG